MAKSLKRGCQIYRDNGSVELFARSIKWFYRKIPLSTRAKVLKMRYQYRGHCGIGDPLRIYLVPTNKIEHVITSSEFDQSTPLLGIVGGEWDYRVKPLEKLGFYQTAVEHFENGVPWENTDRYKRVSSTIKNGGSLSALDVPPNEQTVASYNDYLEYLDNLYRSIEREGYKRQTELNSENDFLERDSSTPLNEIQVFISRDGTISARSGLHRLCFAHLLGIKSVPVRTEVRHTKWQAFRDKLASDNCHYSKPSHPELADLV